MWFSRAISARACLPPAGSKPVDAVSRVPLKTRGVAETWRHFVLRDPKEAELFLDELGLVRPFSDPSLVRRAAQYSDFLHQASLAGVVTLDRYAEATVGIFFVAKKRKRTPCRIRYQMCQRAVFENLTTPHYRARHHSVDERHFLKVTSSSVKVTSGSAFHWFSWVVRLLRAATH